jgi:hypothetical protein
VDEIYWICSIYGTDQKCAKKKKYGQKMKGGDLMEDLGVDGRIY